MAEDPYCLYQPGGKEQKGVALEWSQEARERMERAPSFIRPLAMRMVERYARERGYRIIDSCILDEVQRVAGNKMAGRKGS